MGSLDAGSLDLGRAGAAGPSARRRQDSTGQLGRRALWLAEASAELATGLGAGPVGVAGAGEACSTVRAVLRVDRRLPPTGTRRKLVETLTRTAWPRSLRRWRCRCAASTLLLIVYYTAHTAHTAHTTHTTNAAHYL